MKGSPDDNLTWLFSNRSTVVKAHKPDCGMLRTVNPRSGLVAVTKPEDKADLIDRGFSVTVCKCARANAPTGAQQTHLPG